MKKILTAIDFSDMAPSVVQTAAELARTDAAHLWLIHVAAPNPNFVGYETGPTHVREDRAKTLHREHKTLQESAQWLRDAGLDVTPLLVQGPTAETLLNLAKQHDVDAVVIGSHGHSTIRKWIVGSVTQSILKNAPCPIVVVPKNQAPPNTTPS